MTAVRWAKAFAPASSSNLGAGFDLLGHAIAGPRDAVRATRVTTPGVRITALHGLPLPLPTDAAKNTAGFAAMRLLEIKPKLTGAANLDKVPGEGGLLIVANHPFGILDGLAVGQLAMQLRGNAQILTNSLLCQVPEIAPHLLPVDFSGTPEARRMTSATRRRACDLLAAGKVVVMFPAGGVSTANSPVRGKALDAEWHPFLGRLATLPGVTVLPVHFSGQNSRLFQIASHVSYPLRVALIFHETRRRTKRKLQLTIGAPVTSEELSSIPRTEIAPVLRRRTMLLAGPKAPPPDEVFVWPSHVKW